jgi:hypothetical protein
VTTPRSISGPIGAVQDQNAVMVAFFWRLFLEIAVQEFTCSPSQNGPGDLALGRNMEVVNYVAGQARAAITVAVRLRSVKTGLPSRKVPIPRTRKPQARRHPQIDYPHQDANRQIVCRMPLRERRNSLQTPNRRSLEAVVGADVGLTSLSKAPHCKTNDLRFVPAHNLRRRQKALA